jgi:hypothetical protein
VPFGGNAESAVDFAVAGGGGGGALANRLLNPGFENGPVDWDQFSSAGVPLITNLVENAPHDGNWYVRMGGLENEEEWVFQDVTIPTDATQAFVQFWYRITTTEPPFDICQDSMTVEVLRPADNALLTTLTTLCNYDATPDWTRSARYDVIAFRGQTIRLRFHVVNDGLLPTVFFVDDVALMANGN